MTRPGFIVWSAGVVLGLAAEGTLGRWDEPGRWLPDLAVGLTLLCCGLIAGRWRPGSWAGWLLMAAGFGWFLPNFSDTWPEGVGLLAAALLFVHRGPLLHLVLAYPNGRTSSRPVQAAVAIAYVAAVAQAFWPQPVLALAVAAMVLVVTLRLYAAGSRPEQRARLVALAMAVAWFVLTAGEALAQRLGPSRRLDDHLLLVYEGGVGLIALGLTYGLRTTGWDRTAVTDLVVELGAASGRGLRAELATVLGNLGIAIGFWADEAGAFVSADGHPLPLDDDSQTLTNIELDGRPVAVLLHAAASPTDAALVEAVRDAVRLVAAHDLLLVTVDDRIADVRASQLRILATADEQRHRLETRVSEGALSRLGDLADLLGRAQDEAGVPAVAAQVEAARTQLMRTEEDLRRLARGIHPRTLAHRGLAAAVLELAADSALPVTLEGSAVEVPPAIQAAAYFVCSEAVANAVKHSAATAVNVRLASPPGQLVVEISDNGRGGADHQRGTGLHGLMDRVAALGGTLEVSSPTDGGTRLIAAFPTSGSDDAG
ncbi:MAG: ATP-binding protein [Nocardioides sp.]|uniref:sensor histidine kinase n=1 Tax=Nocardioides sp. TaxID=35761 RepID=UPI0032633C31